MNNRVFGAKYSDILYISGFLISHHIFQMFVRLSIFTQLSSNFGLSNFVSEPFNSAQNKSFNKNHVHGLYKAINLYAK